METADSDTPMGGCASGTTSPSAQQDDGNGATYGAETVVADLDGTTGPDAAAEVEANS